MFPRYISSQVKAALEDSPVILLHGARQTGKSTLVQNLASGEYPARYITLDDATVLAAAQSDPAGFLAGFDGPIVLDEVQRAPEIFVAIKVEVDRNRQPGRYLLTGSANVLLIPRLSESLAGRMEILPLWPLSQGEIVEHQEGFVDAVFKQKLPPLKPSPRDETDLTARVLRGGYPEAFSRKSAARRRAWFGSYITTILQRDVRDLANIEGLTTMPRMLSLLAARVGGLVNFSELSRSLAMPQSTLKRHMALLEATFLVQLLPPWSGNIGKRLVKSPKLYINDTGLIASQLGLDETRLRENPTIMGPLVENFVVMELRKQISWSEVLPQMYHFRTGAGQEIDVVLEDASGRLVGIEVKTSASIGPDAFKGLNTLAEKTGKQFRRGIVLYGGTESVAFGENMHALPISALWRM